MTWGLSLRTHTAKQGKLVLALFLGLGFRGSNEGSVVLSSRLELVQHVHEILLRLLDDFVLLLVARRCRFRSSFSLLAHFKSFLFNNPAKTKQNPISYSSTLYLNAAYYSSSRQGGEVQTPQPGYQNISQNPTPSVTLTWVVLMRVVRSTYKPFWCRVRRAFSHACRRAEC